MFRALSLMALFLLVGCGENSKEESVKPLVIITSPDNPPFEFKDTAQGGDKVIGFDVDVAQRIGEKLHRPVKIIESDFSSIIPSLQAGRADMALAGLTATDERRKSVDMSDPYYTSRIALLIPDSSYVSSEKELGGKKIGVQLGSSHETMAKKWETQYPTLSIVSLNKIGDLVQELKNGRIDGVLIGDTEANKIAALTIGIKAVPLDVQGESFVIAFPKGSALVSPTNEALKTLKPDIKQIEQKWMAR